MRGVSVIILFIFVELMMGCSEDKITGPEPSVYKAQILERYAPRLWFRTDEGYFPSSVEWAFPNLKRVVINGRYWLVTKSPLKGNPYLGGYEYVYEHPFFYGNLESAVVYAFWVDKVIGPEGNKTDVVDLVYFIYYPSNVGKNCGPARYYSHVGDWEYIVVRLDRDDSHNPMQVAFSAHDFVDIQDWAAVEKVEATHVVTHVAWGSHGFWKDGGDHYYATHVCDLHDYCNRGSSWDSWHHMRKFDFTARKGLDGDEWPLWMSENFAEPGGDNPYDPAAGAIYQWGNPEAYWGPWGQARVLTNGPTGPISKGVFYSEGFE